VEVGIARQRCERRSRQIGRDTHSSEKASASATPVAPSVKNGYRIDDEIAIYSFQCG